MRMATTAGELYGLMDPAKLLAIIDKARKSPVGSWLATVLIVMLAASIRLSIPMPVQLAPYITYSVALAPITIFFGPVHATVALALSVLINWYVYVMPLGGPMDRYVYVRTGMYILGSLINIAVFAFLVEIIRYQVRKRQRLHFLLREVAHRGKNLMAVVQAMARQTLAEGASPYQEEFSDRLQALGRSHDLLIHGAYGAITMDAVLEAQLKPFNSSGQISWEGPSISLSPIMVQYLGMALHECATNAMKYGALSTPPGRVLIRWEVTHEQKLVFTWEEIFGPIVSKPVRHGFGRSTIEGYLASMTGGTSDLTFDRDGLMWTLCAPLQNVVSNGNHVSVYSLP